VGTFPGKVRRPEAFIAGHSYREIAREVRLRKNMVASIVKRSREYSNSEGLEPFGCGKFRFVFSTQLATAYGRYGYRRITALHKRAGKVNHKRVERIGRGRGKDLIYRTG